jgi:anti-sigma factor ChrR (cupin superfamily)
MTRDLLPDPEELAALYLAGALPPEEHAAAEARLATDPAFAAAVADLAATADLLAEAGPSQPPPPAVRERLMADLPPRLTIARAADAEWVPIRPGVAYRFLHIDRAQHRFTALVRMDRGARYRPHGHDHPEECLVLEGELYVGNVLMRAGDFQRAEPGCRHAEQRTETGCLLLLSASLDEPPA